MRSVVAALPPWVLVSSCAGLVACADPDALPSIGKIEPVSEPAPPTAAELAQAERLRQREVRRETQRLEREAAARQRAEEDARAAAERAAFERAYPLHGVVFHFIAQVFAAPDGVRPIGYMRRGSALRAKPGVDGPRCAETWHEVPGGGFICRGAGYLLGNGPQTFEPSPEPPALDDALPYAYAYTVRDDIPQYWALPTLGEEAEADTAIRRLAALERERPLSSDAGVPTDAGPAGASADPGEAAADEPTTLADAVEAPPPPGRVAIVGATPTDVPDDGLPGFVRMRMLRGFYMSVDGEELSDSGRRFLRTVRGAYVRASDLVPNEPPTSRGVVLGGDWELPIAIVFRTGARRLSLVPSTGALRERGPIDRHAALRLADERDVHDGRTYVVSRDGWLVRDASVRIVRQRERPPGVPESAKWIHVDLSSQSLTAYEGDVPVFATLVSTGKEGHETPTGLFRIQSKHVSTTMDDTMSADGAYSIEDVPWTMYFHGNFALHGAFWHYTFGRTRSHGCVNLAPADARWLFSWSTPTLPTSWHGAFADPRRDPGTFVYIEE